jgi:hypothetical protein
MRRRIEVQVLHDMFGKLLQVAMDEFQQTQAHRQDEDSLGRLAHRHRA